MLCMYAFQRWGGGGDHSFTARRQQPSSWHSQGAQWAPGRVSPRPPPERELLLGEGGGGDEYQALAPRQIPPSINHLIRYPYDFRAANILGPFQPEK